MIKCLLSRPGLIAGPLHSTPLQIISQSIPRLDPIDSKSSYESKYQSSFKTKLDLESIGSSLGIDRKLIWSGVEWGGPAIIRPGLNNKH